MKGNTDTALPAERGCWARAPRRRCSIANPGLQKIHNEDFKKLLLDWGNDPEQQQRFSRRDQCPQYRQVESASKDARKMGTNEPAYRAAVDIGGQSFTGGWARSKKQATSKAAFEALKVLCPGTMAEWVK